MFFFMTVTRRQEYVLIYFNNFVFLPLQDFLINQLPRKTFISLLIIQITNLHAKQKRLFVHQTTSQQHLLNRYRNNICFFDATYKTTRYSLPLFFVTLKTNVDYQVVGSFTIQAETTESMKEALHVLKKWTTLWNPKMFMVDNCDEETHAIEILFPIVLYRFLTKYQFLYQNIYIHLYFCNIIFPSLFLFCS